MSERVVVRVSEESHKAIVKFAKEQEIDNIGDAVDVLVSSGLKRRAALARYAASKAGEPKPKKARKKKKAKKA